MFTLTQRSQKQDALILKGYMSQYSQDLIPSTPENEGNKNPSSLQNSPLNNSFLSYFRTNSRPTPHVTVTSSLPRLLTTHLPFFADGFCLIFLITSATCAILLAHQKLTPNLKYGILLTERITVSLGAAILISGCIKFSLYQYHRNRTLITFCKQHPNIEHLAEQFRQHAQFEQPMPIIDDSALLASRKQQAPNPLSEPLEAKPSGSTEPAPLLLQKIELWHQEILQKLKEYPQQDVEIKKELNYWGDRVTTDYLNDIKTNNPWIKRYFAQHFSLHSALHQYFTDAIILEIHSRNQQMRAFSFEHCIQQKLDFSNRTSAYPDAITVALFAYISDELDFGCENRRKLFQSTWDKMLPTLYQDYHSSDFEISTIPKTPTPLISLQNHRILHHEIQHFVKKSIQEKADLESIDPEYVKLVILAITAQVIRQSELTQAVITQGFEVAVAATLPDYQNLCYRCIQDAQNETLAHKNSDLQKPLDMTWKQLHDVTNVEHAYITFHRMYQFKKEPALFWTAPILVEDNPVNNPNPLPTQASLLTWMHNLVSKNWIMHCFKLGWYASALDMLCLCYQLKTYETDSNEVDLRRDDAENIVNKIEDIFFSSSLPSETLFDIILKDPHLNAQQKKELLNACIQILIIEPHRQQMQATQAAFQAHQAPQYQIDDLPAMNRNSLLSTFKALIDSSNSGITSFLQIWPSLKAKLQAEEWWTPFLERKIMKFLEHRALQNCQHGIPCFWFTVLPALIQSEKETFEATQEAAQKSQEQQKLPEIKESSHLEVHPTVHPKSPSEFPLETQFKAIKALFLSIDPSLSVFSDAASDSPLSGIQSLDSHSDWNRILTLFGTEIHSPEFAFLLQTYPHLGLKMISFFTTLYNQLTSNQADENTELQSRINDILYGLIAPEIKTNDNFVIREILFHHLSIEDIKILFKQLISFKATLAITWCIKCFSLRGSKGDLLEDRHRIACPEEFAQLKQELKKELITGLDAEIQREKELGNPSGWTPEGRAAWLEPLSILN